MWRQILVRKFEEKLLFVSVKGLDFNNMLKSAELIRVCFANQVEAI